MCVCVAVEEAGRIIRLDRRAVFTATPWRLIGERVRVTVGSGSVRVLHAGCEVAVHAELKGRHGRSTDDQHLAGIAGTKGRPIRLMTEPEASAPEAPSALLRPLADYEAAVGGGF